MRIGAFARRTHVSAKMLRHYDRIDLLKPAEVDPFTGYRMYTESQEDFVRWVGILRNLGFSLAEIKAMLTGEIRDQGLIDFLKRKRSEITNGMNEQIQRKIQIDTLIRILEKEGFSMEKKIRLTDLTQTDIHDIKKNMPNMEMFLDDVRTLDARRGDRPLVFLRLDLWHFKAVNDDYGFEVGDAVIVAAYDLFKAGLEPLAPDCVFARSHGDEFMACFPGDAALAERIAAGIVSSFEGFDAAPLGLRRGIGCYIGGVIADGGDATLRQRIDDTHEAIEAARKKGRNTFVIQ